MDKIDFVITWVDGSDPEWRKEKEKWKALSMGKMSNASDANSDCRYNSDDESLRYWFRSVEKFAPWVNKIFFVTNGQKPYWLDVTHPKLQWVKHDEFIPNEYLPTFNAGCILTNLHRIEGLAEHFVIFDDDMFLLQPLEPDFYFKEGFPKLVADLRYAWVSYSNWSRTLFNIYCVVNNSFDMRKQIWEYRRKWFNIKELGLKRARQNFICYLANKSLPCQHFGHLTVPQLKSTMSEVWEKCPEVMENTCKSKFRSDDRVNSYIFLAWNQAKGLFYPVHEKNRGKYIEIKSKNLGTICELVRSNNYPQICINDSQNNDISNDESMRAINNAFNSIFPQKSSFEIIG